jgi:Mrp family chromosome partitioning ATPase
LASETMMHLIEFVREQYDLIIFDSPSVLLVTDALILARWVDAILLVVKSSQTRREQVSEAVKQLNRANSNLLGVVLNSVSAKTAPGRRVRAFGRSTEPDVVNFYTAPVC